MLPYLINLGFYDIRKIFATKTGENDRFISFRKNADIYFILY